MIERGRGITQFWHNLRYKVVCNRFGQRYFLSASLNKDMCNWLIDWLICIWVRGLSTPMQLGLDLRGPLCPISNHGSPVTLLKFQMAPPKPKILISSGSKITEPRCTCLSEAKASHSQRMWAEVSSLTPHFLHKGLSISRNRHKCLLKVLRPVRRPVTILDWVLLRLKNLAMVPRLDPEMSSRACLWVSPKPHHCAPCWLTNQRPSLFCKSRLETCRAGSGPRNLRAEPPLPRPSAISLPRIPAWPGTQYTLTACREEMFNVFWHWWNREDVVLTVLKDMCKINWQFFTFEILNSMGYVNPGVALTTHTHLAPRLKKE